MPPAAAIVGGTIGSAIISAISANDQQKASLKARDDANTKAVAQNNAATQTAQQSIENQFKNNPAPGLGQAATPPPPGGGAALLNPAAVRRAAPPPAAPKPGMPAPPSLAPGNLAANAPTPAAAPGGSSIQSILNALQSNAGPTV